MEEQVRPETGPMRFGEDWPGIFIRGDCAFGFAMSLQTLANKQLDPNIRSIYAAQAEALAKLLLACDVSKKSPTQTLRSWKDCAEKPKVCALIFGRDVPNAPPNCHDEDCFGYYTEKALAIAALDKYFEEIGDPWPYDEKEKVWRKGESYAYIAEHEMNVVID